MGLAEDRLNVGNMLEDAVGQNSVVVSSRLVDGIASALDQLLVGLEDSCPVQFAWIRVDTGIDLVCKYYLCKKPLAASDIKNRSPEALALVDAGLDKALERQVYMRY